MVLNGQSCRQFFKLFCPNSGRQSLLLSFTSKRHFLFCHLCSLSFCLWICIVHFEAIVGCESRDVLKWILILILAVLNLDVGICFQNLMVNCFDNILIDNYCFFSCPIVWYEHSLSFQVFTSNHILCKNWKKNNIALKSTTYRYS